MSFGNIFDRLKDALDGDDERIDGRDIRPASEDPYGDPADQEQQGGFYPANNYDPAFGNVLPASEDPYGDPADQEQGFGNIRPASEDPYGDPADQEERRPAQDQGIVGNVLDRFFGR